MITQKMKYALKALMELANEQAGEGKSLRIEEIAKRGSDAGECKILRLRSPTTNNAHEIRPL